MLIDCDIDADNDPQLTIPLRIEETKSPRLGVVTDVSSAGGYIRVFCDGASWSVRNESIYSLKDI